MLDAGRRSRQSPADVSGGRKNVLAAGVRHGTGRPRTGWLADNRSCQNAQDLRITWLDAAGQPLDSAVYHFTGALEKGLEGKVCAKFETAGALQHPQFRCLLAMPPMPSDAARAHGGLLSHLHFRCCSRLDRPCCVQTASSAIPMMVPHHVRWCRHPAEAVQHCASHAPSDLLDRAACVNPVESLKSPPSFLA